MLSRGLGLGASRDFSGLELHFRVPKPYNPKPVARQRNGKGLLRGAAVVRRKDEEDL